MKIVKTIFFILAISMFSLANAETSGGQSIFDKFDSFFTTYVNEAGLVNYNAIRKDPTLLNSIANDIKIYSSSGKQEDEVKSFYINAYNLLVIKQLVEAKNPTSPLKIGGFFEKNKFTVAGESFTLNDLEKKRILEVYKDPRVHFILVCGALGCPPLLNKAYFPATLEKTINDRTVKALNSSFIKPAKKGVQLSKIFEWYEKDFSSSGTKGVISYINKFRTTPIEAKAKVSFYEYDWTINELK